MNRIILLVTIFSFLAIKGFSQHNIAVFTGENILIGTNTFVLEDENKSYTIDSIISSSDFVKSENKTIGLPLSKSDFWLKLSILNKSNSEHILLMLENPLLNHCELFYKNANHEFTSKLISNNLNFSKRKYKNQNAIFDLYLSKDSVSTFYVKVNSKEQLVIPIVLGKEKGIAEYLMDHDIMWGVLIGILLVMIFYNLFLFVSVKDISYFYYVLYTTFILLTQITLSGYTFRYLFTDSPIIFNKAIVVFPGLAGIFGIVFIRFFLQLKKRTPKLNYVFILPFILYAVAIILKIIGIDIISYRLIDVAAITSIVLIYTSAIIVVLQGYRPAKFFLLAWSVFFIGLILFILKNMGLIGYNFFTNYTMQLGTILEVTLLSLALADRINILKIEKEESQAQALAALKENERIVLGQNVILEQKVNERTLELIASNNQLGDALEDLKQAQSQLVESEKMASLGQLTAGIAHEINNPINFVTSNVAPLKRDVEMLFLAIDHIESVGLTDKNTGDKKQEIDDYKEELDYDYLKTEINHLLKGIYEGASRTAEIVKGLRVFSRVDEDDLKMADINEGLSSTLLIMNSALNSNFITVHEEFAELPLVECYPGKLNQVFLNIISNAIDAIKTRMDEKFKGELRLKTIMEDGFLNIIISDNGIGMDDKTKSKIFDPFYTTKEVGEGTGLGMSIAYNTIKKHNGQILVSSEKGEGTEIMVKIPIS